VVFGALIAVLVLLCTGQSAGAAVRQPAHSQHAASQHASGAAKDAAAHKAAAARKAAEHRAALRKAAARKAAARKAVEQRAAYQTSASRSSDAARPAAASRAAAQEAAKRHATRQTHRTQQSQQHQRKTAKQNAAKQSLADRKQAAADARDNRQASQDNTGSVDSPAALPSRSQLAAKAAAQVAARLAAARKAAEQLAHRQAAAAARPPNSPGAAGQPAHEVGIRTSGSTRSTSGQQPAVSLSPGTAATHTSPPARPRPARPSGSRSLPHRIITEPAEPIAALATAGLSLGSGPALLVLAVIAGVGLLLVAAGTRRSWLRG
jgi:hypothetical protein